MRRSGLLSRGVALVVALLAVGCATERQVQWGEETAAESTGTVASASSTATPVTAVDYAARFPTDGECESEARRIVAKSPDLALRLIKACVARGDFKRIAAINDAPWSPMWATDKDAPDTCARVVAARAGDVENDVKACAGAGIAVATLDDLFTQPEKAKGKRVIFRARLDTDLKDKDRVRLIETALESGELETLPTGRRVAASFGSKKRPTKDAIILAKTIKIADDTVANDGEFVAVVDVDTVYLPAASPTF